MSTTMPQGAVQLLTSKYVAVVATVRPDGAPAAAHVWVDWDGEHILFSSRSDGRKARNVRGNPYVAVHVVGATSAEWVAVRGRVVDIQPDTDLAFIDRLSQRYKGAPYSVREFEREIYTVQLEHVRSSAS